MATRHRPRAHRPWAAIAAALSLAVLVLLVVTSQPPSSGISHLAPTHDGERLPWKATPPPSAVRPPLPRPIPSETPPWESTPGNTPTATRGLIPAWKVRPPTPPTFETRPPVEPPNPIIHRPPMDNPGGFDGDRPPRETP